MLLRLLSAGLLLAVVPNLARTADPEIENPFKNVKKGDSATYKMSMKVAGQSLEGTITQTVKDKTEKEVTLVTSGKMAGRDIPGNEQKIDLTKPFDPTKFQKQAAGADIKTTKGKEGKEKIKIGDKEYDSNWTIYTVEGKANGIDIKADMKVWLAKDLPMGLAKMEMNTTVMGMKMEMTMQRAAPEPKK